MGILLLVYYYTLEVAGPQSHSDQIGLLSRKFYDQFIIVYVYPLVPCLSFGTILWYHTIYKFPTFQVIFARVERPR